jgi:hypothetical protein
VRNLTADDEEAEDILPDVSFLWLTLFEIAFTSSGPALTVLSTVGR